MKCCDLTSGQMRNKITIQRKIETPDGGGGSVVVWSDVVTLWCKIKPVSGSERLQSMRLESDITQRIYTRYRDDFTAADRINYNGRLMQIKAIINIEEKDQWLEVYATEGQVT